VRNYIALAREYAQLGMRADVQRVCREGLRMHPGSPELSAMRDRANKLRIEERVAVLREELDAAPRSALWSELCKLLLEAGRLDRAEETAQEWYEQNGASQALYWRAVVLAERFWVDRHASDGREAFALAGRALADRPQDVKPLYLQEEIATRVGAWNEARECLGRMLEVLPGDPAVESRYRRVVAQCDGARDLEEALSHVERTGQFECERVDNQVDQQDVQVRPMLQELGSDEDVKAAVYLRGGTALVQGPHGATAERMARAVRELVVDARGAARLLRLGQPKRVLVEGGHGSLLLSPGDQGASAVWCTTQIKHHHEELLRNLSGMADHVDGEDA
jgi:tetratricopeptide (TPR) repeat protein